MSLLPGLAGEAGRVLGLGSGRGVCQHQRGYSMSERGIKEGWKGGKGKEKERNRGEKEREKEKREREKEKGRERGKEKGRERGREGFGHEIADFGLHSYRIGPQL